MNKCCILVASVGDSPMFGERRSSAQPRRHGLVSSMRYEHAGVSVRAVAETETRCLSLLLAVG